jgi:hypothetical protein
MPIIEEDVRGVADFFPWPAGMADNTGAGQASYDVYAGGIALHGVPRARLASAISLFPAS